jgi:hypothetical protein
MHIRATTSGPFFQGSPGQRVRANLRRAAERSAERLADKLRSAIAAIPPAGVRTGRTRAHIGGRVTESAGLLILEAGPIPGGDEPAVALFSAAQEIVTHYGAAEDLVRDAERIVSAEIEAETLRGLV